MKRFLFISILVLFFFQPVFSGLRFFPSPQLIPTVFAQTPTPPQPTPTPTPTVSPTSPGDWVQDPMVTFLGQTASRAENFMDWTLVNYKWDYVDSSLINVWVAIRNIVYAVFILAILVTAFLIIINGGKNVSILIFTRKFIFALLFVTFSFAIARFLYQIADIFQMFFFQTAGTGSGVIAGKDIVNISFTPQNFTGFRRTGIGFDESAFVSLLLIQLSSVTFYVIGSILSVRKIILWFFLVASPLYPIVFLYESLKSTGKIWIREFLRWLLYAPLFALFLSAVVIIWKSNILILPFQFFPPASQPAPLYPTAISILVGGPGQQLSLTNSLNYPDTYAQYVIALLMLWVAIFMPFILLQILLDFLAKYEPGNTPMGRYINTLQSGGFAFLKKPQQPPPLPTGQFPAGEARNVLRQNIARQEESSIKRVTTVTPRQQESERPAERTSYTQVGNAFSQQQTTNQTHQTYTTNVTENKQQSSQTTQRPVMATQFKPEILARPTTRLINFPIPTMRDIVNFETARLSRTEVSTHQLQQTQESLEKIANPKTSATPQEAQHFTVLREQLNQETTKGDVLAKSILSAASTTAQTIPVINFPAVNQIQTVSFDDYEAVKSLWLENYQQIDVPEKYSNRRAWIEDDGEAVSLAMTLLSSPDPLKVREGLSSVSNILPFLLIGGFSQTEVIAYLKAKYAAGRGALEELAKKEENQETLLEKGTVKKGNLKQLSQEAALDEKDQSN